MGLCHKVAARKHPPPSPIASIAIGLSLVPGWYVGTSRPAVAGPTACSDAAQSSDGFGAEKLPKSTNRRPPTVPAASRPSPADESERAAGTEGERILRRSTLFARRTLVIMATRYTLRGRGDLEERLRGRHRELARHDSRAPGGDRRPAPRFLPASPWEGICGPQDPRAADSRSGHSGGRLHGAEQTRPLAVPGWRPWHLSAGRALLATSGPWPSSVRSSPRR